MERAVALNLEKRGVDLGAGEERAAVGPATAGDMNGSTGRDELQREVGCGGAAAQNENRCARIALRASVVTAVEQAAWKVLEAR